MSLCQVPKTNNWHACIEVDKSPRTELGSVEARYGSVAQRIIRSYMHMRKIRD
jgi:hypothetical protein